MGKAGRWFRSFFVTSRKGRKSKDTEKHADADNQSVSSLALPPTLSAREKRRWSFRRPAAPNGGKVDVAGGQQGPWSSQCFSEAEVRVVVVQEQDQRAAAVPEVVMLPPPPASEKSGDGEEVAAVAATKIQSAFRSYLARKALCALRGMVKLQAMVRGQLVRRQASVTLRRMQALVDAQMRARAERLRLLDQVDDGSHLAAAKATAARPGRRPSPHRVRASEESVVKIVEVDDGGVATRAAQARRSIGGGGCCCLTAPSRTPAKADLYQKVSPTPSALTEASVQLEGASSSEPATSRRTAAACPSYMANTESSRAKARSQSAPRQRFASVSESSSMATSPCPSCGEWTSSGGARRRASLDPLDLLGARAASNAHRSSASAARVERCASRMRARAGAAASLPTTTSECGSSAWHD